MEPPVTFAALLRELRAGARLTQEELAEASGVRPRSISDLERGVATSPQRETIRRLADALNLAGAVRAQFEAVARGRAAPAPAPPGAAARGTAAAATRTLPRDIASFTGRQQELDQLVAAAPGTGGVVSIHAIGGMAGVGKTAFAVRAAHRLAERFPGGQIFLPLHGHTPGQVPVDPVDALASLLSTVGVPAGQIPPGLEARMALWRDRVAERQLLLVLDDAASSDQVLPLLPGAGGSLVLVTSRRHLSALDDATTVSLDTLPPDQAAALLVRLSGRSTLSPDDPAVAEITRLCGYLPLAIGMVARQLHHHPAWTTAGRAAELASERDRLELMATENLSVAAAFDLSYADLSPGQQRLFRRLGLHPGTDVDVYAAAALDGSDRAAARRGLETLYDQYLLVESLPGRYRMHDLIREYAGALAGRLDPAGDRDQAVAGLLDYYQQTATLADAFLARWARSAPVSPAQPRSPEIPALANDEQALAWARAERASLLACLDYGTATGQHARVIALTAGLAGLLRHDGPWGEALARHAAALRSAEHLGDGLAQAGALVSLADVQQLTSDFAAAAELLEQALVIYRGLGDPHGQANVLIRLGNTRGASGDYPGTADAVGQALVIYRDLGERTGLADACLYLGMARRLTGDYPAAAQAFEEALDIYRDLGNRVGEGDAVSELGQVRQVTGDYHDAVRDFESALDIYRDLGNRLGQANELRNLGSMRRQTGDYASAARDLEEALDIHRAIGNRIGQGATLTDRGSLRRVTGDWSGAAEDLAEALSIHRDIGNLGGEVDALNESGKLYLACGDPSRATSCHQQALDLTRQTASSPDEAQALSGLGHCALAEGQATQAEILLRQALEIFQRIGAAEAADLLAELDGLTGSRPAV